MKPRRTTLSPTAQRILHLVMSARITPTMQEMAERVGVNRPRIRQHMQRLRKLGLLAYADHEPRTVQPTCRFIPVEELG